MKKVEEESKMSFWKKCKISIFGLEKYQELAIQKIGRTIGYLAILMAIFAFFVTISVTYRFHQTISSVFQYIDENIQTIEFKNGNLSIQGKDKPDDAIIIEENQLFNGKIIIDTKEISEEQITKYTEEIKNYYNGMLILKDKIIVKTNTINMETTISLQEISQEFHIVNVEKQDILNLREGSEIYQLDVAFFIAVFIGIFVNFFATTLLDAILYSLIAYIVGICTHLKLRYSVAYNIAIYSLTLPILLNIIYAVVHILTGYTITYFSVMHMAITCIYIFAAILMIKSDVIKKQMELSKIIAEQEKVKQELERQEQERREEEERKRVRKEDEKRRQEEKRQ